MARKHNLLTRVVALCLLLGMIGSMMACSRTDPGETGTSESTVGTESTETTAGTAEYTITVTADGGAPLEGVGIFVYTDETMEELVWFAKTDADGKITFTDVVSDSYIAVLSGVPEAYTAEETYPLTGETTGIVLVGTGDLNHITYQLRDVVQDFTVTTPDGTEYILSELLKTKKAVVLNFFYQECVPCQSEFPFLQEAYEVYSEDVEVLAMNPVNTDNESLAAFQSEMGVTFPMALCDPAWANAMQLTAYPTTVVIDRTGTICLIHKGMVTEAEIFARIFAAYTDDAYEQTIVESIDELPEVDPEEVMINNPTEVGGVTSFQMTVRPGEVAYCDVYKVSGMYMQINNPDAYVVYKNNTYTPSNGVVGLVVTSNDVSIPVTLGFGNSGTEIQTFTINFSALQGSYGNPFSLVMGDFTTSINAGNNQGVYFTYKATENGTVTVKCLSSTAGVDYDYVLYNLNSYAYRNYANEGAIDPETGCPMLSIKVSAGDKLQFIVSTLPDDSNSYPAGSFKFRASFSNGTAEEEEVKVEKITYGITVTDENRKPIPGVSVYLTAADSSVTLLTDEKGVAGTNLPKGTYTAKVAVPEGYEAHTAQFTLTESVPTVSVKLETMVPEEILSYTVKVLDEAGKPISGVLVSVDTSFALTDEEGAVTFSLVKGEYTALIGLPEGYTSENPAYTFADGVTELTVTLQSAGAEEPTETPTVPGDATSPDETTEPGEATGPNETTEPGETTEPSETTKPSETTEPTKAPEETTAPPEETTEPTEPDGKETYRVTVLDASGAPVTGGVMVQYLKNGSIAAMAVVGSNGVAETRLEPGDYTVKLAFTGTSCQYDESTAILSASVKDLTIRLAAETTDADITNLYVCSGAYNIYEGVTHIQLGMSQPNFSQDLGSYGSNCFFVFMVKEPGAYQIRINSGAKLSYWGSSTFYISNSTENLEDYDGSSFTVTFPEDNFDGTNAIKCIIGVEVVDGIPDSILTITKTGEAINRNMVTEYVGSYSPNLFTLPSGAGSKLVYVDVTASTDKYKLVYNETDQFYHLGTANGPVMYVNLGYDAPYELSIKEMLETTSMNSYYYDADGYLRGENYTTCMLDYVSSIDKQYGVYPLTKDLEHMIKEHGKTHGWWDTDSFVFRSLGSFNPDIIWMYACCYVPQS